MAYVNVKDWSVDQVIDWLKGLDSVVLQYSSSFLNNGVTGGQLLNLRADDLEHLGVNILGHQEIILEAVEHLRHFHYELDKENLQSLALKLSCTANSLYRELLVVDESSQVKNHTLSDVHNIISTIKPLVYWLDRAPFAADKDYIDIKIQLLQLAFELATSAHRDIFFDQLIVTIKEICSKLTKMADHIIQDLSDPMILQPASLDLATLKKKEQELGLLILPSNHAIHQIAEIKFGTPAHVSSKIEEGDEIVQVNYMTIVGWHRKNVMFLLQESPPEIVLTLKKRPRHTKVYGQIYMKPYRLPSKKRGQPYSRWNESLPSPVLLPIPDLLPIKANNFIPPRVSPVNQSTDTETEISESDSDSEPPDSPIDSGRMYPLKPRPILQRRNSFAGVFPSNAPYFSFEQCREILTKHVASRHSSSNQISHPKFEEVSKCLRDKSASCSTGLELNPRPTTIIGLASSKKLSFKSKNKTKNKKQVNFDEKKVDFHGDESLNGKNGAENKKLGLSLTDINDPSINFIDEDRDLTDRTNMTSHWQKEIVNELIDTIKAKPSNISAPPPPPVLIDESTSLKSDLSSNLDTLNSHESTLSKLDTDQDSKNSSSDSASLKLDKPPLRDSCLSEVKVHDIIKKLDEQSTQQQNLVKIKPKVMPRTHIKKPPDVPSKDKKPPPPLVPPRSITTTITTKVRGKLDKSHSTPAYDFNENSQVEIGPIEPIIEEKISKTVSITKSNEINQQNHSENKIQTNLVSTADNSFIVTKTYEKKEEIIVTEVKTTQSLKSETIIEKVNLEPLEKDLSKYELGIPIVSLPLNPAEIKSEIITISKEKPANLLLENVEILPPKPPPRTFGFNDLNKPAYPADSPKPQNLLDFAKQQSEKTPRTPSRIFEFPETRTQTYSSKEIETIPESPNKIYAEEKFVRSFDPKLASTPAFKNKPDVVADSEASNYKMIPVSENIKSEKISPTNSIVRAMIYPKSKQKRKNLIAKRRKVTVNELSPADLQGYLYQRLRDKHTQLVQWEKRYFVLFGNCLYGFKQKEDPRAACLIFLSEFTVTVASEVKSRSNAFRVYHTGTCFYFSTEDPNTLQCWIEQITAATLTDIIKTLNGTLFSETDDSDTEKSNRNINPDKTADPNKKFNSLKKFTSKKNTEASQASGSTSLDRKWFFNKSNSQSKNALPVPTAQFRSYRKIKNNESSIGSITTGNFTSHVPMFMEKQNLKNTSVPNLTIDHTASQSVKPLDIPSTSKLSKTKPLNYIHASNPSLCNSSSDFSVPIVKIKKNTKPYADNLAGFVTLEELMIRQSEERKLNPHAALEDITPINLSLIKPDVVYGEVPIRPKDEIKKRESDKKHFEIKEEYTEKVETSKHSTMDRSQSNNAEQESSSCFGKRLGSLKKNQKVDPDPDIYEAKISTYPKTSKGYDRKLNSSLPRMSKLQERYKENEAGMQYFSDRNLASGKLIDKSYEMIYCPETVMETVQFAQNRTLDDRMYSVEMSKKGKIKKQHSFTSSDKKFKAEKSSFFDLKSSKISDSSSSRVRLKSAHQYIPILPLTQDAKSRPQFAFELNLDEKTAKSGKLKQIFGKQGETKKEKTFLGSPKLHRAIFKKNNIPVDMTWPVAAQPIRLTETSFPLEISSPIAISDTSVVLNVSPHADYPGLEYPPVFEPETYSLADPQSSLTILRKQGKTTSNNN